MNKAYTSPFTDKTVLPYTDSDGSKHTAISKNYRIPALVTLADGTLVAAADVRWDTYYDGGGLETAVAYSTDNGISWSVQIANYLGDNGNVWNPNSSTFIDPALLVKENTVYMVVDIYAYGIALNGGVFWPVLESGFDENGKLMLKNGTRTNKPEDFGHYLGEFDEVTGYATIFDKAGSPVEGYAVDGKFNLYTAERGNYKYLTNIFVENGIFEVMPSGFLYLTKSEDGGKTWSNPMLLNLKEEGEFACLIGPGRGLATSQGMLLFPCYSFKHGLQQSSFLYSWDEGKTWARFAALPADPYWSGESVIVELKNGNLRCFFRNGSSCLCYADILLDKQGRPLQWDIPVQTTVSVNSNTQLSAISYSKEIDGCEAILISCCMGKDEKGSDSSAVADRLNGSILLGLIDEAGRFEVKYNYKVTNPNEFFAYSCITELTDGSIGLIYEKAPTEITFAVVDMENILT